MARITSSAEGTEIMTAFPPNTYRSHISDMVSQVSKVKDDGSGGNPMMVFEFTVDEGSFKDRRVGYYNVMTGGKTSKGNPMPIRQLLELIDGFKIPWAASKDQSLVARPFKKVKAENGSIVFVDPDTNQRIATVDYDDADFLNKTGMVRYGIRKQDGTDREFNEVIAIVPNS